jgi:hypothetical protein
MLKISTAVSELSDHSRRRLERKKKIGLDDFSFYVISGNQETAENKGSRGGLRATVEI